MRLPRTLSRPARQGSWICPFRAGPGLCIGAPAGVSHPGLMSGHAFDFNVVDCHPITLRPAILPCNLISEQYQLQ